MTLVDQTKVKIAIVVKIKFMKPEELWRLLDLLGGRTKNLDNSIVSPAIHSIQHGRLAKMDKCMFQYMQNKDLTLEIRNLIRFEVESMKIHDHIKVSRIHVINMEKIRVEELSVCRFEDKELNKRSHLLEKFNANRTESELDKANKNKKSVTFSQTIDNLGRDDIIGE